jgi:hypothetical protein
VAKITRPISRAQIIQIYNFLITKLTPKAKAWLTKINNRGYWRDDAAFNQLNIYQICNNYGYSINSLTFAIEEMVHALLWAENKDHVDYTAPLPMSYLIEIQLNIMKLHPTLPQNKEEIIRNIIQNIGALQ